MNVTLHGKRDYAVIKLRILRWGLSWLTQVNPMQSGKVGGVRGGGELVLGVAEVGVMHFKGAGKGHEPGNVEGGF